MAGENTIFTEEELKEIDEALAIGAAVCVGFGGGPACGVVAGTFSTSVHALDWFWDDIFPEGWKAHGEFDWDAPYDPIFAALCSVHERVVQVVDETWRLVLIEKGLPPEPSPAGAFLNDWVNRNGWRDGGRTTYLHHPLNPMKFRWIELKPEKGPWAFSRGPMPKRPGETTVKAYVTAIVDLMKAKRLSVLEAATRATMEFIALNASGSRWKTNAGMIREASWVHGTAVECEHRSDLHSARWMGWGARYSADPGQSLWFHAQIPTPAVVDDVRPVCSKVFLLYETAQCQLEALHVYDGNSKVLEIPILSGSGNQNESLNSYNSWLLFPYPTIQSGMGLSALIRFEDALPGGERPWVTFSTAGADFNRSR